MHLLDSADLIIMALRFRNLPDEQMKHFVNYVESGKPMIGLRTSTHAFRIPSDSTSPYKKYSFDSPHWPGGFGQQVLGDTWIDHHGHHNVESTRGVVNEQYRDHVILNGAGDIWGPTDVYGIKNLPKDAQVLLWGQVLAGMLPTDAPVAGVKNDPMMPLAWTKHYKGSSGKLARVFCTTMGSSTDFQSDGLRRLIVNASYWALELPVPDAADVQYVGSFEPTDYGFDTFKKGIRPADHNLK
jgi:type 1 glutamine amidotransferase